MGLDTVEIVLRVEETFGADLPDDELGSVSTVGDLYNLLLSKLGRSHAFYPARRLIAPVPTAEPPAKTVHVKDDAGFSGEVPSPKKRVDPEVWHILKEIIVDQLQINPEDVVPEAHFGRDLGSD